MIAVVGGLGAAVMWALSTLSSTRSTRWIGAASVLSWIMLIGLGIDITAIIVTRTPLSADSTTVGWMAIAGVGNMVSMLLLFFALRAGNVGLAAPVASTEGAVAALVAVLFGESLPPIAFGFMLALVIGILLAAHVPALRRSRGSKSPALALALGAALVGGVSIYATGFISSSVDVLWVLLPPRLAGVLLLALPMAVTGRLIMSRAALPFVVVSAVAEMAGFTCFALGARESIAIAAVLGSLFAALAAIGGYFLFHERMLRHQIAGIGLIVLGVAGISATRV